MLKGKFRCNSLEWIYIRYSNDIRHFKVHNSTRVKCKLTETKRNGSRIRSE